jgi:RNA polymerase sigma factor (sigma-70 family)
VQDFERFFEQEYGRIVRSLALAFGRLVDAEDAAQAAFAIAFRHWKRVAVMDRPGTWVYVVALRDHRRRMARDAGEPVMEQTPLGDAYDALVDRRRLVEALGRLTERRRMAVVLRYYADLSVAETAEAMGCAPGTVKASVHAALKQLNVDIDDGQRGVLHAY